MDLPPTYHLCFECNDRYERDTDAWESRGYLAQAAEPERERACFLEERA